MPDVLPGEPVDGQPTGLGQEALDDDVKAWLKKELGVAG